MVTQISNAFYGKKIKTTKQRVKNTPTNKLFLINCNLQVLINCNDPNF
jgi:hypothetical protein